MKLTLPLGNYHTYYLTVINILVLCLFICLGKLKYALYKIDWWHYTNIKFYLVYKLGEIYIINLSFHSKLNDFETTSVL